MTAKDRVRVDEWCVACSKLNNSENGSQVVENLKCEKHLKDTEMIKILKELKPVKIEINLKKEFINNCSKHKLKGPVAKVGNITRLYRVVGENTFVDIVPKNQNEKGLNISITKKRFSKLSKDNLLERAKHIEKLALPGDIVWATFFEDDKRNFLIYPQTATYVFKILGLNHYLKDKSGYCYMYEKSELDREKATLHVPTIADAGFNQYFRPSQESDPHYGNTFPIDYDIDHSMPEVVHKNLPGSVISDVEHLSN